jgi:hypothetical protein
MRALTWSLAMPIIVCWLGLAHAEELCLTCHAGIEPIGDGPVMGNLPCTACHRGTPDATGAAAAHEGMWANPADLRVADQACGGCHGEHVAHVKTSLHATMAGVISGTRYDWGAQDRQAIYATYAVENPESTGPGTVTALAQLPTYDPTQPEGPDNTPADDYLRNQCLRCHLWSDGHQRDGDWRASGCAACHVVYLDTGIYEGGDQAIPKGQKDRPRLHKLTSKIPEYQCIHCHNRGGRTGVSFIGTMESDGYGTPWTRTGDKQPRLHGKHYNQLTADVHYQRGMTCIDCHTLRGLHGDGNLYTKREHGVEIECEDCHGTMANESDLTSSWGNPLPNLSRREGEVYLTRKMDSVEMRVPQIKTAEYTPEGHAGMVNIPAHMDNLECYACHAQWAPQCYGCHAKQDVAKPSGDWLNALSGADPSKAGRKENREATAYSWSESRSYLRWGTPVLGWNTEGRVSPFIPGCQVVFTQMDGEANRQHNRIYRTVDGTLGLAHNPIQPHTVTTEARSCADCHMSRKALGLGTGIYRPRLNGLDLDTELEQIVTAEGVPIQATNHEGARPFNRAELQRMARAGTCIACHGADPEIWEEHAGQLQAPDDDRHEEAIQRLIGLP